MQIPNRAYKRSKGSSILSVLRFQKDINSITRPLGRITRGDGLEILLCTDAAGGSHMKFCNIEINCDIPCLLAIRSHGGNCIGIVGSEIARAEYEHARGRRTTVGSCTRNYKKGSDLGVALEGIVNKVGHQITTKRKESRL